jgi:hypothetical protein
MFVGIILAIAAIFMKAKVKKATGLGMFGALIIGIVLAGGAYYFGAGEALDEWLNPAQLSLPSGDDEVEAYQYASFTITPTAQGNSGFTINSDKTQFSLPIWANTSSNIIYESDNTTWVDPDMKFVVKPLAWTGATADDLAIVYFEFNDPNLAFTVGSTSYYAITKTGGNRNIAWQVDDGTQALGVEYVEGSHSMLLTSPCTVYCNLTCSNDLSRIENLYDPLTTSVTFFNADRSWTQSYYIDMFIMHQDVSS